MLKNAFLYILFFLFSPGLLAADLLVDDPGLQECVNTLAKKHQWHTAESFVSIVCHNKGIETLAGLENFINVKKLSFHKNNITHASFSSFPNLEHLNIARNKLETLELSKLPNLKELYFFGNNIHKVHLGDLENLARLKASSSEIEVFSYNNLPKLEKIYLFDNKMETIDIYKLPAMKYMDVRQNPMPDELYEDMDRVKGVTILHDGNAEDWQ